MVPGHPVIIADHVQTFDHRVFLGIQKDIGGITLNGISYIDQDRVVILSFINNGGNLRQRTVEVVGKCDIGVGQEHTMQIAGLQDLDLLFTGRLLCLGGFGRFGRLCRFC